MKRWLHLAGGALGVVAVGSVAQRLLEYTGQIDLNRLQTSDWSAVFSLAILYGFSNILLALAWMRQLAMLEVKVSPAWAIYVYGISQLAKYVPGNVFQFAGRQALGMSLGVGARPLAKSVLWELGLIAIDGVVFGLLAVPLISSRVTQSMTALTFVCTGLLVAGVLRRLLSTHMAAAWCLQLAFLGVSGGVFVAVLAWLVPEHLVLELMPAVAGAYVVAGLAGLVTPGAPAGVGIRETVLLFMLDGLVMTGDLLLAVLLGSVITVAGDLLFFCQA